VAVGGRIRGVQPPEIPGMPVVVEDDLAIQLLQVHRVS
jgi:hypothetical protein